jgi:hypothetical protein
MDDRAVVEVTVLAAKPARSGRLVALATVEIAVGGVAFVVHGVQVVAARDPRTGRPGAAVFPPHHRGADGRWRPTLDLPPELEDPLGRAVLERCAELGLLG